LTARHHPGESNSSYIMKGLIDFLISETSLEAIALRKAFVFKIVPMINVDGVIYGNYRCSLSGIDLNRVWFRPNKSLFPEVHGIKRLIEQFNLERQVVLFTDIHGHSMARKAFFYGNNYSHNPY
jgi:murein tripeptide amidase MpaA